MAFYATQNGTILLEAFARTAASPPYRIYSIKRCPRSNAADGSKITNKRRPRINRAPSENKENLGKTCSLSDVPLLAIFCEGGGVGGGGAAASVHRLYNLVIYTIQTFTISISAK